MTIMEMMFYAESEGLLDDNSEEEEEDEDEE